MCGRARCTLAPEDIARATHVPPEQCKCDKYAPCANAYPGCYLPVMYQDKEGKTVVRAMKWGLVPSFTKPDRSRNDFEYFRMFNARSETIGAKGVFKRLVSRHRCVVLADAFYEWKLDAVREKQPYSVYRKDNKPLFLAGLYDVWRGDVPERARRNPVAHAMSAEEEAHASSLGHAPDDAAAPDVGDAAHDGSGHTAEHHHQATDAKDDDDDASVLYTFTILTSTPIEDLEWLHDRMPVILDEHDAALWVDVKAHSFEELTDRGHSPLHEPIIGPHGNNSFAWHPCSKRMNTLRYQAPDAGDPISREEVGRPSAAKHGHTGPTLDSMFKKVAKSPARPGAAAAVAVNPDENKSSPARHEPAPAAPDEPVAAAGTKRRTPERAKTADGHAHSGGSAQKRGRDADVVIIDSD